MKYKIRCSYCGKTFIMESQHTGMVRCQCPHCNHIITCSVGTAKPVPRQSVRSAVRKHLSDATTRIGDFQKRRRNGDLIVFFSFSFLFVISVIVGLFVTAEVTKVIVSGKSWLFHAYLNYIYS